MLIDSFSIRSRVCSTYILGFYNEATDALLNQYGTEVSAIKGSSTWKSIIVYINMLRAIGKPRTTQFSPGLQSYLKNFKTPFFWRFFEFLQLGNSNRSKNDPKKFFWKYLKNDGRYSRSKFCHSRWRCWCAGWDMTKIFLSI